MRTAHIIPTSGRSPYLTITQARRQLGISRAQLCALAVSRDFPLMKVGRTWQVPRNALVAWLAQEAEVARVCSTDELGEAVEECHA